MDKIINSIVDNQWIIQKKLSSGSFGIVYLAEHIVQKLQVAVKLEREEQEDVKALYREVEILTILDGIQGTPKLFWSGEQNGFNVMVVQLLGKDLSHYLKIYKKFPLKNTLQIAQQTIKILEQIHKRSVIHRDLKPENIMFGNNENSSQIHIIDFGISKLYIKNNKHINFKKNKSFIGTTRYASVAAHKGYEMGRKDDLESLFYVILYLLKGTLPWQNLQIPPDKDRTEVVGELKSTISIQDLCKDAPQEFVNIFEYLQTVQFNEDPDYQQVQDQIQQAASNNKIILDNIYEWSNPLPDLTKTIDSKKNIDHNNKNPLGSKFLIPPEKKEKIPVRDSALSISGSSIQVCHSSMQVNFQISTDGISEQKADDQQNRNRIKSNQSDNVSLKKNLITQAPLEDEKLVKTPLKNYATIESTMYRTNIEEFIEGTCHVSEQVLNLGNMQVKIKRKNKNK